MDFDDFEIDLQQRVSGLEIPRGIYLPLHPQRAYISNEGRVENMAVRPVRIRLMYWPVDKLDSFGTSPNLVNGGTSGRLFTQGPSWTLVS